jgi:glycosyltransferase EpsE
MAYHGNNYRISVIIGIYNCASTLIEALDSLYAQTYQNFKIILCDDGSTDETYNVAKTQAELHNNIILIKNEQNRGLNFTLNHCLKYVDTEYVARMDGDDISLPSRFEQEVNFLDEHPEYAVVSGPMIYFDEKGDFRTGIGKGEIKKEDFLNGSPICHAPCMGRAEAFKAVGCYTVDDKLLRVEDYHLWFKMFAAGYKLYMLKNPIYKMRDDRNATVRRNWKNRRNEAYVKHIGFKMIGLPWYYQIYCLRPILIYFMPSKIYNYLHTNKK